MANKVKLAVTLAILQTFSLPVLMAFYKDQLKKEVPEDLTTPELVLADLLQYATPLPEPEAANTSQAKMEMAIGKFKGKSYAVLVPKVDIPGKGIFTALEIASEVSLIEHLIKIGCVGSILAEV